MIEFGDRVRDVVSGFTGIAIGYTKWMTGCGRWVIQPEVKKDGQLPECQSIDESQIAVVKKGAVKRPEPEKAKTKEPPGGPHPTPARA